MSQLSFPQVVIGAFLAVVLALPDLDGQPIAGEDRQLVRNKRFFGLLSGLLGGGHNRGGGFGGFGNGYGYRI